MYGPDVPGGLWVVVINDHGKTVQSMALGYLKANALYQKRAEAARLINGLDANISLCQIMPEPAKK